MDTEIKNALVTPEGRAALRTVIQAELVGCALNLSGAQERRQGLLTLLALVNSIDADYAARDAANTIH